MWIISADTSSQTVRMQLEMKKNSMTFCRIIGTFKIDKDKSQFRRSSGQLVCLLCGMSPVWIPASYLFSTHVGSMTDCHAGHQGVSRFCTRGESEEWHVGKKACKQGIHPSFKIQGRSDFQNRGISGSSKFFLKRINKDSQIIQAYLSERQRLWGFQQTLVLLQL